MQTPTSTTLVTKKDSPFLKDNMIIEGTPCGFLTRKGDGTLWDDGTHYTEWFRLVVSAKVARHLYVMNFKNSGESCNWFKEKGVEVDKGLLDDLQKNYRMLPLSVCDTIWNSDAYKKYIGVVPLYFSICKMLFPSLTRSELQMVATAKIPAPLSLKLPVLKTEPVRLDETKNPVYFDPRRAVLHFRTTGESIFCCAVSTLVKSYLKKIGIRPFDDGAVMKSNEAGIEIFRRGLMCIENYNRLTLRDAIGVYRSKAWKEIADQELNVSYFEKFGKKQWTADSLDCIQYPDPLVPLVTADTPKKKTQASIKKPTTHERKQWLKRRREEGVYTPTEYKNGTPAYSDAEPINPPPFFDMKKCKPEDFRAPSDDASEEKDEDSPVAKKMKALLNNGADEFCDIYLLMNTERIVTEMNEALAKGGSNPIVLDLELNSITGKILEEYALIIKERSKGSVHVRAENGFGIIEFKTRR